MESKKVLKTRKCGKKSAKYRKLAHIRWERQRMQDKTEVRDTVSEAETEMPLTINEDATLDVIRDVSISDA